jgi:hypothetical protein
MFLTRRPSQFVIDRFLRDSQDLQLSYGPVGIGRDGGLARGPLCSRASQDVCEPGCRRNHHARPMMRKPLRYSFGSGFVWIGVASLIAYAASPIHTAPLDVARTFAGGIVSAPLIGLLVGQIARRFSHLSRAQRIWVAWGICTWQPTFSCWQPDSDTS